MKTEPLRHPDQTQCTINKLFSEPCCSGWIILCYKLDDLLEIRDRAVRDQDFDSESFREFKSIAESSL